MRSLFLQYLLFYYTTTMFFKKIFYIIYLHLFIFLSAHAQSKRDQNWIIGYTNNNPAVPSSGYYGGMQLRFEYDSVRIYPIDIYSHTPTGVANTANGDIAFYTSGCAIYNAQFDIMDNGEDINNGTNFFCGSTTPGDRAVRSGTVVLPIPDQAHRYIVLYLVLNYFSTGYTVFDRMMMAEVDMEANNGLGKVIQKNELAITDSLVDAVSAVKHANGRDWWIVAPRGTGREFWILLLTPQGLQPPVLQSLPLPYTPFTLTGIYEIDDPPYFVELPVNEYNLEAGNTQSGFSADGRKFCRIVREGEIEIYHFDRCQGQFSLLRLVKFPRFPYPDSSTNCPAAGLVISPNSKYVYFNNTEQLFQMNISDDSVAVSNPILIEAYDGFLQDGFFPATFFQMRNAPNGKIYMAGGNGTRVLHVINKPNEQGLACDFKQHSFVLPRWTAWTINYFPNFNLGAEVGTICDSIPVGIKEVYVENRLLISPNPVQDLLSLQFEIPFSGTLGLYDITGGIVLSKYCTAIQTTAINTSQLSNGVYILKYGESGKESVQKIVVAH